jgi:DNA repair photolyase
LLQAKREVSYSHLATGKWINKVAGNRHSFEWSVNPYRGCEMACQYCYARYTHEFMELREPEDFETRIFAKVWDAAGFRKELAAVPVSQAIAIGTATDPYQHAERRYELTRRILDVLATVSGRKFWITTKSDLPARDVDVMREVARRNVLYVNFTVTTMDDALARGLEPKAPRPALRMAALGELTKAGVKCGAIASPVIPGLNDTQEQLGAVAEAARAAGAHWFGGGVLFLKSPTREVFLGYLEREHPELRAKYEATFTKASRPSREYHEQIETRFDELRMQYGLSRKATPYLPPDWESGRQLGFAF